jgi:hypothetical protein
MHLIQFRIHYPEFRTAPDDFVQAFLDQAATMVSEIVVGTRYDQMHGLKAAHLIALSPGAVNARLVAKDGTTTYEVAFKQAALSKVAGVMAV